MKKFITVAMAIAITLVMFLPCISLADVIWEPDNSFYRSHSDECTYIVPANEYVAAGENGSAPIYTSPTGSLKTTVENGTAIYSSWIYTDKNGCTWALSNAENGWINLYDYMLNYNSDTFTDEYADAIDYSEAAADNIVSGNAILFWSYPGATEPRAELDVYSDNFAPSATYVDKLGRTWAYYGYIYAQRDVWCCVDDPQNPNVWEGLEQKQPVPTGAAPYTPPKGISPTVIIIAGCAAALVALLAVGFITKSKKK